MTHQTPQRNRKNRERIHLGWLEAYGTFEEGGVTVEHMGSDDLQRFSNLSRKHTKVTAPLANGRDGRRKEGEWERDKEGKGEGNKG